MNELPKRVMTALLLFPLVIAWLFWIPSPWFDWLLGVFATLVTIELVLLVAMPMPWVFVTLSGIFWGLLVVGSSPLLVIFLIMISWTVAFLTLSRFTSAQVFEAFTAVAYAQWMILWLFFFVWIVARLHAIDGGIMFITGACLGVWASDIAAYFVGRRFGRTKLFPAVSPGKSVEGFMAAIPAGVFVAVLVWHFADSMQVYRAIGIGIVLVLVGIMGDLTESTLKRLVGAKDSGRMLPGHGGLLDRMDSLLPALPAAGLLWLAMK